MDTADLFENGNSQAVRLPEEYRLPGNKVHIKKLGNVVILIPEQDSWQSLLQSIGLFTDDFMAERIQPETQTRVLEDWPSS
jgi:antitoxin VapB